MRVEFPLRDRNDLSRVIETQNQLYTALKLVFDLLEDYSPLWYTKRYHDEAQSALSLRRAQELSLNKRDRDLRKAA
jgi:hypothetical protein